MTKLHKFRVEKFRSIRDSGWIDTNNITALIGTNESGKTNLLIPLWKLKPANDEPIRPLDDYPRKSYLDYKNTDGEEVFITAEFEFDENSADVIAGKINCKKDMISIVQVSRSYNGKYIINFPNFGDPSKYDTKEFINRIGAFNVGTSALAFTDDICSKTNQEFSDFISNTISQYKDTNHIDSSIVTCLIEQVENFDLEQLGENGFALRKKIESFLSYLQQVENFINLKDPTSDDAVVSLVVSKIPNFVYYADYGNLDSEIYLPHVIDNIKRNDLSEKDRAKVRTLKVLFDFVGLDPQEILELGKETVTSSANPSIVQKEAEKKKEREILLQSASTKLTSGFLSWWKQGNYKFRFQADGNHFRIWVCDNLRPEEVGLEGRSRGLQWFFSFFLVFLVESNNAHMQSILLLDEPGLSLHPMAQYDLIRFFETLSQDNLLIYTTHSPFLVDSNHLEQIRAVYLDKDGFTSVSADLRVGNHMAEKSIYPVNAALGLTVSDTLFLGAKPIIVEGVSDQVYLNIIKIVLLSQNQITINKELVFVPAGGVKGISSIGDILQGRNGELPIVILDSDRQGKQKCEQLKREKYNNCPERVITVSDICGLENAEIEDIMPKESLARTFSRISRVRDYYFEDEYVKDEPIVGQMESFVKKYGVELAAGWKAELAKAFATQFWITNPKVDEITINSWKNLFAKIL